MAGRPNGRKTLKNPPGLGLGFFVSFSRKLVLHLEHMNTSVGAGDAMFCVFRVFFFLRTREDIEMLILYCEVPELTHLPSAIVSNSWWTLLARLSRPGFAATWHLSSCRSPRYRAGTGPPCCHEPYDISEVGGTNQRHAMLKRPLSAEYKARP